MNMTIIIGLGNPGEQYKNTRHNVGFMAIDKFAEKNNFSEFKLQKKSTALVSEKENIILAKPQTFMNESGKSAKKLLANTEAKMADLVIIHDDIDLETGKIKIVSGRGSAGHKGVESIIQNIGNDGLIRFRIGVAPAQSYGSDCRTEKAMSVVLKKFSKEEQEIINQTIEKTAEALNLFIKEGLEKTMQNYN